MKNLNPLYLTEGPIGDNLKLIKAFQKYGNPNRLKISTFNRNAKKLRDRYAKKILDLKKMDPKAAKKEYKRLLSTTSYRVDKYRDKYGELPDYIGSQIFPNTYNMYLR
jgi:hypothetical protein